MVRASGCDNGLPVARAPYGVFVYIPHSGDSPIYTGDHFQALEIVRASTVFF
jgi:hypothetical protein